MPINFDRNSKKELQVTVPDVILAQYKAFHSWGASEDEILLVVPIICFVWERPALKTLVSLVPSISCHLNAPQPMLRVPPPRRWWVISRRRCARAQILQRMPRQRPWSGSSPPSAPKSVHHLSARRGIWPDCWVWCCQSSSSKPSSPSSMRAAQTLHTD